MSTLDLTSLIKTTDSLTQAIADAQNVEFTRTLTPSQHRLIIAGVIQNFEFCYEQTFKMLKRQLEADAASPSEVDQYSFRDLLRTAAEKGLIHHVEDWFEFRQQRNITSHTYDEKKAQSVFAAAIRFQQEASKLLQELKRRND